MRKNYPFLYTYYGLDIRILPFLLDLKIEKNNLTIIINIKI